MYIFNYLCKLIEFSKRSLQRPWTFCSVLCKPIVEQRRRQLLPTQKYSWKPTQALGTHFLIYYTPMKLSYSWWGPLFVLLVNILSHKSSDIRTYIFSDQRRKTQGLCCQETETQKTQSGCKPAFSTPYMPTFIFYFSYYNINVKFNTLQTDLVSISINPLFRNKKKRRKNERNKIYEEVWKRDRPIPWVRLDGLSVSGTICLHYWQTLSHNPPHEACLWMARLECKLSALIEKQLASQHIK